MATILDVQNNLKGLKGFIHIIAKSAIDNSKDVAIDLNVHEQLEEGFNSKGERLKKYKKWKYRGIEYYDEFKNKLNPKPGIGNPDLILTGDFTKSFTLDISGDSFKMWSDDEKTQKLVTKYGDDIFGLSEKSIDFYAQEVVLPLMMDNINEITGL